MECWPLRLAPTTVQASPTVQASLTVPASPTAPASPTVQALASRPGARPPKALARWLPWARPAGSPAAGGRWARAAGLPPSLAQPPRRCHPALASPASRAALTAPRRPGPWPVAPRGRRAAAAGMQRSARWPTPPAADPLPRWRQRSPRLLLRVVAAVRAAGSSQHRTAQVRRSARMDRPAAPRRPCAGHWRGRRSARRRCSAIRRGPAPAAWPGRWRGSAVADPCPAAAAGPARLRRPPDDATSLLD